MQRAVALGVHECSHVIRPGAPTKLMLMIGLVIYFVLLLHYDGRAQEVAGRGITLYGLKGQYKDNKPFEHSYTALFMPIDSNREKIDLARVTSIAGAVAGIVVYGCGKDVNSGRIVYTIGKPTSYVIYCKKKPVEISSSLQVKGAIWTFSGKLHSLDRFDDGRPYEDIIVKENYKIAISNGDCRVISFLKTYEKKGLLMGDKSLSKYWSVPGSTCKFE